MQPKFTQVLFWRLPYEIRRDLFRTLRPRQYEKLLDLTNRIPDQLNHPTYKLFRVHKCIFVHIPKAAGISIGYSLFGRHTGNHARVTDYQLAFSKHEYESFFKFTFVRNPWDRLASAFFFLQKGGRNDLDKNWALEHLHRFSNFEEFVLDWVSEVNIEKGVHFVPQYKFITLPRRHDSMVDFIGRFENLARDYDYIRKKVGIGKSLRFENRTKEEDSNYKDLYTGQMIDRVSKVYRKDIEMFGYNFS